MRIYTTAIQRGGTGKTTTTAALGQAAAYKGYKTLLIDMDPQGNLSFCTGSDTTRNNIFDVLNNDREITSCTQSLNDNLDIIPASWSLSTIKGGTGAATKLKKALQPLKKYDYVFIDTPATAGILQYNALYAATDGFIIPLEAEIYSLQSLYQITDAAQQMNIKAAGLIFTQANFRSTISKTIKEKILAVAQSREIPYLGDIRTGVAIKEAAALKINLYQYAPKSNPAKDYLSLLDKLL